MLKSVRLHWLERMDYRMRVRRGREGERERERGGGRER